MHEQSATLPVAVIGAGPVGLAAAASGCCGGPAPAMSDGCCALDAEAKAAGRSGCGCTETQPIAVSGPAAGGARYHEVRRK